MIRVEPSWSEDWPKCPLCLCPNQPPAGTEVTVGCKCGHRYKVFCRLVPRYMTVADPLKDLVDDCMEDGPQ